MRFSVVAVLLFGRMGWANDRAAFPKVEPADALKATAQARATAGRIASQLGVALTETPTRHFTLHTDWPRGHTGGLARQLELTYAAVAQQFGLRGADEDVFRGKLLVVAVADPKNFEKLADEFDGFAPAEGVLGYFRPHDDGTGHLFVRLPALTDAATEYDFEQARSRFSAMLAREVTLAFLHRYSDKNSLPNWVNRGVAMAVQRSLAPHERLDPVVVRYLASSNFDLTLVFDPDMPESPHFDAAALSLVDMLLERDRAAFVSMLEQLRNGAKADVALRDAYNLTYEQAAEAWRRFIQTR